MILCRYYFSFASPRPQILHAFSSSSPLYIRRDIGVVEDLGLAVDGILVVAAVDAGLAQPGLKLVNLVLLLQIDLF